MEFLSFGCADNINTFFQLVFCLSDDGHDENFNLDFSLPYLMEAKYYMLKFPRPKPYADIILGVSLCMQKTAYSLLFRVQI